MVQVEIAHDGGDSGFGEAAPIERYDESADVGARVARAGRRSATTRWRSTRSRAACRRASTRRARRVDAALHDLQGKLTGLPVYRLLGLRRAGPPTSWTIWLGDPDDMARRTEKIAGRGFRRLKLKLGGRDGLDLERVHAVRARHRPAAPVRRQRGVVARRGARATCRRCELEYCEQPLPAGDPDGPELKRALAGADLRRRGLPHARRRRRVRRARARHQHQAREVGRDPRGGAHGARGARARARRDARLHGRVRARHRRRARTSRA